MNTLTELQEPDAKLLYMGRGALTDNDIMSLILAGTDNKVKASRVLQASSNNFDHLSRFCYNDLKGFGLSHLQAIRTIAVIEFAKRMSVHRSMDNMEVIRSSADINSLIAPIIEDLEHEEFWVILLNRANRVIKKIKISQGGVSGTVMDVRIVLRECVNGLASGFIACHNHPSGNNSPSDSDIRITQKLKEAGALLDVQMLDHLIIARGNSYYSFADNGQL